MVFFNLSTLFVSVNRLHGYDLVWSSQFFKDEDDLPDAPSVPSVFTEFFSQRAQIIIESSSF